MLISVMDVINIGQQIIEANNHTHPTGVFWVYGLIFLFYFLIDYPLSWWAKRLEKEEDWSGQMAEQILQVEHLEKYYQKKHVLHDINFHVDKGEVVTLLGPSGSGKSTLIRCLNGLEEYRQGTITFEGKQINTTEKNWQQIRQKSGWSFQSYDLFPNLTVMDNILLRADQGAKTGQVRC